MNNLTLAEAMGRGGVIQSSGGLAMSTS